MTLPVPVDAKRQDWPRLVANAVNDLQKTKTGEVRYNGTALQWWNGSSWINV